MDPIPALLAKLNHTMFKKPVDIFPAEILPAAVVVDIATNSKQTMRVLRVSHLHGRQVYLGMPGLGPGTIFGEILMGVALLTHPNHPNYCFYDSRKMYEVAIKRSEIAKLNSKLHGNSNEENPLNEIAIMELMQTMVQEEAAQSKDNAFSNIFPHNMSLELAATDGESLFTVLPRMKNCMDLFAYCFENAQIKSARAHLPVSAKLQETKMIIRAVLRGVAALHERGIAHRDLSLENALISVKCFGNNGDVTDAQTLHIDDIKIIDYGMAVYHPLGSSASSSFSDHSYDEYASLDAEPAFSMDEDGDICCEDGATSVDEYSAMPALLPPQTFSTPFYGKRAYIPPECFYDRNNTHIDPRTSDIWACGIMLFAMVFDEMLFETAHHIADKNQRFSWLYQDPVNGLRHLLYHLLSRKTVLVESTLIDLLVEMLRFDPCQRLTVDEVLAHPWFASLSM